MAFLLNKNLHFISKIGHRIHRNEVLTPVKRPNGGGFGSPTPPDLIPNEGWVHWTY